MLSVTSQQHVLHHSWPVPLQQLYHIQGVRKGIKCRDMAVVHQ